MPNTSNERPGHLEPSKLGTKEYWDTLYTNELLNHAADPSDIGTIWFDDSDAEDKIVQFLSDLSDPSSASSTILSRDTTSFLDLGCGNGSLLFALRGDGWSGRALGVDFSPRSIAFANQISASKAQGGQLPVPVEFCQWDIIAGPLNMVILDGTDAQGWDVVLDKGTFDAISLSEDKDSLGRRLCEAYPERILQLVRDEGIFLVTSCNWTEEELEKWFTLERVCPPSQKGPEKVSRLEVVGKIRYRTFNFGGAQGQTISTLCLKKTRQ
ncbi:N-lysine methyltransferase SEE1 [Drechmeria coniospora]|uniref:Protein-lysine N-methyltransferase EFM4 n=1 Tax=Drechmeria coniospora TaxID=98403 RepID=A0A151GHW7_DRECN|nr:N-lysine methyltransferase SEE1 [Drechmeria coniospora]KYK56694.1 N-lysine methyltransferase SEE1 [Drechmeria coniospora]